jgi:hypothetical protein
MLTNNSTYNNIELTLVPPESSACDGAVLFTIITANGEEQSGLYSTNGHEESAKHGLYIIYS